jgi:hypothetical protein
MIDWLIDWLIDCLIDWVFYHTNTILVKRQCFSFTGGGRPQVPFCALFQAWTSTWATGVQVLFTRTPEHAHWLVHFCLPIDWFIFCLGYLLWRQSKKTRQKYDIQMLVHWVLFSGVSYYDNKDMWLRYKRERTPKHSAIWLILNYLQDN